ncbi:MAG: group III truncated hemoglobin [Bacteroidia bacterium]
MKTDIQSTQDIVMLVDTFYKKVNADALLAPVFNEEAGVNWPEHLPKMYQFWGTQLLGTQDYKGQPFPPHMKLHITPQHFQQWLILFTETVHQLFEGAIADLAIYKAKNIAVVFQYKLGLKDTMKQPPNKS